MDLRGCRRVYLQTASVQWRVMPWLFWPMEYEPAPKPETTTFNTVRGVTGESYDRTEPKVAPKKFDIDARRKKVTKNV